MRLWYAGDRWTDAHEIVDMIENVSIGFHSLLMLISECAVLFELLDFYNLKIGRASTSV